MRRTTALEFEDDDDGQLIGYARILKTPEKERRVRLRPINAAADGSTTTRTANGATFSSSGIGSSSSDEERGPAIFDDVYRTAGGGELDELRRKASMNVSNFKK
jgi:hypothetical protein